MAIPQLIKCMGPAVLQWFWDVVETNPNNTRLHAGAHIPCGTVVIGWFNRRCEADAPSLNLGII